MMRGSKSNSRETPAGTPAKEYWKNPYIKSTAEFIRMMNPPGIKRRRRVWITPDILVYGLVIAVLASILFFSGTGSDMREVNRTVTPDFIENVEIKSGRDSSDSKSLTPEEWYNLSLNTTCEGINLFYMRNGFMSDWTDMLERYGTVYSSNDEKLIRMMPPRDMLNSTNYDCEDIAHATRCLAELYNVTCEFWTAENMGHIVPKSPGHLGVCCNADGWECI